MFTNKKNCYKAPENFQEQGAGENSSLEEQVLSNLLILDNIFKYLNAQDIIRASMVNRTWRDYSLEFLKINSSSKKSHYPVCIQIRGINPCRALARFNSYLIKYQFKDSDQDRLIFNGIQQAFWNNTHTFQCTDCLIKDWKDANRPHLVRHLSSMKSCYAKILEKKIKFKYIRFNSQIPTFCPFALFMKFIISESVEDILELDFGDEPDKNDICPFYLQNENNEPKVFPNLEILGIKIDCYRRTFPIVSPALKTIRHFIYKMRSSNPIGAHDNNFPFHALTILEQDRLDYHVIKSLLSLAQTFGIKVQGLEFSASKAKIRSEQLRLHQNGVYRQKIFELGQLVSSSLIKLCCPLIVFTLMAGKSCIPNLENGAECKNTFPSLKTLHVQGPLGVEIMDWFCWMELSKHFPQLEQISFRFLQLTAISDVSGPYNKYHGCGCNEVKTLTLNWEETISNEVPSRCWISRVLSLFPHIRHLELGLTSLSCHTPPDVFTEIVNEIENLPFLEEISVRLKSLKDFCLDHIFLETTKLSKCEQVLGEVGLEHLLPCKSSILDHSQLKRISVASERVDCNDAITTYNTLPGSCYTDQPPDRFLVSSRTAKNICKYRPGFEIHVRTDGRCNVVKGGGQCNNNVGVSGLRFEHLEPYTRITTSTGQMKEGGKYTLRVLEFINK